MPDLTTEQLAQAGADFEALARSPDALPKRAARAGAALLAEVRAWRRAAWAWQTDPEYTFPNVAFDPDEPLTAAEAAALGQP